MTLYGGRGSNRAQRTACLGVVLIVLGAGVARAERTAAKPGDDDVVVVDDTAVEAGGEPASVDAVNDRPYRFGAGVGPQFRLPAMASLARFTVGGSRRWFDRLHVGARFAVELGRGLVASEELVEAGVVLHASRSIDVLLGWRTGHARFAFGYATVHALAVDVIAELSVRLSRSAELRFTPFAIDAYRSGLWQFTTGPELGIVWRP